MKKFLAFLAVIASALLLASCGGGGGYSGTTTAATALRITPPIGASLASGASCGGDNSTASGAGIGLSVGTYADFAVISQGVPPYYVGTTGEASARLMTVDGKSNTLRVFGRAPTEKDKKGAIWVSDSSINQTTICIPTTVYALPPIVVSPDYSAGMDMTPGEMDIFAVYGSIPPYVVTSSNPAVATVGCYASASNSSGYCPSGMYTVTAGASSGAANLTIISNSTPPDIMVIPVTVKSATAAAALAVSAKTLTGAAGSTAGTVNVSGGTPPYSAVSSDTSVATATVSGSVVTVNYVSPGTATIIVLDAAGASVTLNVTVTAAFKITPATGTFNNPDGAGGPAPLTFTIAGGTPPYSAPTVHLPTAYVGYVSAAASGSTLTVTRDTTNTTCLASGTADVPATVTVTDSASPAASASVTVTLHYTSTAACP